VPQKALPPSNTVTLSYTARFDAALAGVSPGEQVRLEAIVTFGNAGARGGSGAVCSAVDANGNGTIEADEANVRSVPCRTTVSIPSLERSNASVVVRDDATAISTLGTVAFGDVLVGLGLGAGAELASSPILREISAAVDPGAEGGSITNCADLLAETESVCNPPARARACDTRTVVAPVPDGFETGDFCSYTQGGWGSKPNGGNPGARLAAGFSAVYPAGVEIGVGGSIGRSMKFTAASAIESYLPAGGTASTLSSDLLDPTSSSAGVLGGQVLALRLNVDFGNASALPAADGSISGLILQGTGTSLDGQTVAAVLAATELAIGGGGAPADLTLAGLNEIVTRLNEAFDNCTVTEWAHAHLRRR
jgi:hypothetical protein